MYKGRILRSIFGRVSALFWRAPGGPRACGKHGRCRERPAPVLGRPKATARPFVGLREHGLKLGTEMEDERPPVETVSRRLVTPAGLRDDPREVADLLQDRDRAANPGFG